MFEQGKSGSGRRRKSLLSFSRDAAGFAGAVPAAPATPRRPPVQEAQDRHRMARSRREARSNPLLSALAAAPEPSDDHAAAEPPQAAAAPVDRSASTASAPPEARSAAEGGIANQVRAWSREGLNRKDDAAPAEDAREAAAPSAPAVRAEMPPVERRSAPEAWTPLIDPMRVIGGIFESKRLIIAATLLGMLAGVGVALTTPKKFQAATELLIDPRDLKLSDRDLTQQGLPSDATLAIVENQVRILSSGTVLGKVVDRLNLTQDDEFNGHQKSFGIGAVIGELRTLLSRKSDEGGDEGRERTMAIESLADALSVERGGKTFVVTIAVKTQSGQKSALIANTMADVFLETYGQLQAQTVGRASDELVARLDELRTGVEEAERKVAEFKAAHDIIDPQGRPITDDEIVKLNEQLSVARARTLELNARAASVRGVDVDSIVGGAIPESINSSIITELRSQYASLKSESDRLAVRLGPRHPDLQAIQAQLAGARQQISAELSRIANSIQVELKRAVELEQQLAKRLAQLKVRQGDIGTELVKLRELERDVATKRAVYESFLLRAKETGEQRDINTANMSVISRAYAPLSPTGPSRVMMVLAGMILGFGSGVGFAAMRGAYEGLRERRRQDQRRRAARPASDDPTDGGPRPRTPGPGPSDNGPSGSRASQQQSFAPVDRAERAETEIRTDERRAGRTAEAPRAEQDEPMLPRHPVAYEHGYDPPAAFQAYPAPPYPYGPVAQPAPAGYPVPVAYSPVAAFSAQPAPYHVPAQAAGVHAPLPQSPWAYPLPQHGRSAAPYREPAASGRVIAGIRADLAEVREALRDLGAERRRRRFF